MRPVKKTLAAQKDSIKKLRAAAFCLLTPALMGDPFAELGARQRREEKKRPLLEKRPKRPSC